MPLLKRGGGGGSGRAASARCDIEPARIVSVLPGIGLFDVEAVPRRYRLPPDAPIVGDSLDLPGSPGQAADRPGRRLLFQAAGL